MYQQPFFTLQAFIKMRETWKNEAITLEKKKEEEFFGQKCKFDNPFKDTYFLIQQMLFVSLPRGGEITNDVVFTAKKNFAEEIQWKALDESPAIAFQTFMAMKQCFVRSRKETISATFTTQRNTRVSKKHSTGKLSNLFQREKPTEEVGAIGNTSTKDTFLRIL